MTRSVQCKLAMVLFLLVTVAIGTLTAGSSAWAAPTVISYQPANGATVPVTATVQATFSEAMDPATITTDSFSLSKFVGIKAISAGHSYSVALKNDGTVVAWGSNQSGQTTVPTGLSGVTAIAAGYIHSVALKNDGTVVAWGSNGYGQTTVPVGLSGVTAIAAGDGHSVVLKNDGTVVAWGRNDNGQTTVPAGLSGVTAIAAGFLHSVALKNDGTVVAWGNNSYGQTTVPAGLSGIAAIAAGFSHSIALKSDGTVVAWGSNDYSQLTVPAGLSGVTAIAAGESHSVALKNDGTVVALGPGQTTVPVGLSGVTAIAAGFSHSIALKSDGTVVAWGYNGYGQTTVPVGLSGVTAIAAGRFHSVALKNDGTVVAWGNNDHGQTIVPAGLSGVTAIAAGESHSVALKNDGTVVAWGYNGYGQTTVPAALSEVTAIAAGYNHSIALKNDGTVVAWGNNYWGQATVPAGLSGVMAIAAGGSHNIALKNDGTVVAWGSNDYGQTTVPTGLSGVTAIAAGYIHSIALKNDGTVVAWGHNDYGQTTISAVSAYETAVDVLLSSDSNNLTTTLAPSVLLDYGATYNVAITGVRSQVGVSLALQTKWSFTTDNKILWTSPTLHDFGSIIINTAPATQTFTISNTHATDPVLSFITIVGPDASLFSLTTGSCASLTPTIAAGGSCTVNVAFLPTSTGSRNATLQIASPDPVNQTVTIPLSGSGVLQSHTLSLTMDGTGSGTVNSSPGTDINCTSGICAQSYEQGTTVTLSAAAGSGSSFTGWSGNCSETGSCVVTMDTARSVTANFTADPVPAVIGVSATTLSFSNLPTYTSETQSVTISNSGTVPLVVSNATLSGSDAGSFVVTPGTCDSTKPTIAPAASCLLDVIFQPTTTGSKSATFTIVSNGSNSPTTAIALAGSAYDPPPFGSISINGGTNQTKTASITLSLSAYDNSGQVAEMRFSNNNSSWSSWEMFAATKSWTLMTLGGDGVKTVYVQYKDAAGNAAGSVADTITYDTTTPIVTITAKPADIYTGTAGTVSFTANELVSGYECKLDSGSFAACTSPAPFSGLADGSHTFSVRATDLAGNLGSVATATWTIDATPPDTTITAKPASLTTATAGSFSFTTPDATASIDCSLDSSAYAPCNSPFSFTALADGSHTFNARAKDPAGNYDPTPATYSWTIDTTPPDTTITGQPANPATSSPFTFTFSANEAGATFECRVDGGTFTACTRPYSISSLANGSHTFQVRAKDPVGHYDPTPASYSWTVDITGGVKIGGNNYATLTAALSAAADGSTLQLFANVTPESITYSGTATLTLSGGYDGSWNKQEGSSSSVGTVTIVSGTLIFDGIVIL